MTMQRIKEITSHQANLGITSRINCNQKFIPLIFILPYPTLWRYSKKKESLAAYIHHFKREAKRCNFTINTATIRIFVKGLKNAHTLAMQIYEKGPQTCTYAISEVEKPKATKQLTSTLTPSSTMNVMFHEGGPCFQCQELGHIAHHCPNV